MYARLATCLLLLLSLACAGIGTYSDLGRWVARAELQGTPEALELAQGMQAVALRCNVGGDLEADRCRAISADCEEAVMDGAIDADEVKALIAAYPELGEKPEEGEGLERLRASIEGNKRFIRNDFREWTPDEIARRMEKLGWEDVRCDEEEEEGGTCDRCRADIGPNVVAVRVYGYSSRRALRAANEETYIPGASETRGTHILNVRAYEEASTKLVAKKMGLMDDALAPKQTERWLQGRLERAVKEVYTCDREGDVLECYGGDPGYRNAVELEVGKRDPGADTWWGGATWRRTLADGTYVEVDYLPEEVSALRLEELLDVE